MTGENCIVYSSPTVPVYNFAIISHVDHGKSTLADRMLELTGTVEKRQMKEQLLDVMELEREKGITIKLQPVRMEYRGRVLNLIDTPGHVDFQYEVSRSLKAVEGIILLVDATQGIQAQTVSNLYLALEQDLEVVPVINKIDLPAADVDGTQEEIQNLLGSGAGRAVSVSAKTGAGVEGLLDKVVRKIPPACTSKTDAPLRCLIFDSVYDDYKGVVAYVRVVEGEAKQGKELLFMGTGAVDRAVEVGVFIPAFKETGRLRAGEIGYIATGLKNIRKARVGDTITTPGGVAAPLPGFMVPQPKIFAGIYPASGDDFALLREAIAKLQLNDASLSVRQERSQILGQGLRCGFLGMLHLEIVQERLRREYALDLMVTAPSVLYRALLRRGKSVEIRTPSAWPDPQKIAKVLERHVVADVVVPARYLGVTFKIMREHEGHLTRQEYMSRDRWLLQYRMPLRELVVNLYDQLKSATSGYGSLSYELGDWREADVVKLQVLVNHEPVEALATIVPRGQAQAVGRRMVRRLKEVLPRQMFAVPLQAAVGAQDGSGGGSTILARETLPARRKDVTGHLYGGDYSRKRKLLEKQKKGKKKMAGTGKIDIPPQAYLAMLKK